MHKTILITGATSGIGEAVAEAFAKEKFRLILTGRRVERLNSLTSRLVKKYEVNILPLNFDVREMAQVEKHLLNLPQEWQHIDILINNAGLAVGLSPLNEGVIDDWERMIDTNIKGLLYVSKIVSNLMIEHGGGHIVNIGSIAGKSVYPNGNVYCATKYAVDALSKGMMMDFIQKNIKVSQVCPGAVETEFSKVRFKGDEKRAAAVYEGFEPLNASDVADLILYIVKAPAHVNISDVVILPAAQASPTIFCRK
ncbi:MAG TPA: SDR family NAD(P)-dependent oxidoreductase [Bacteroidales bacterium]|nr:NAD(P)-dependent oxidoreductase [Rikenellaceae bacterium]HON54381.1 SDR family NAD(P)-dependent oxidoreductase [Bacteroidales bacterium]HRR49006.1 SDR family NAD(P)-dependent oxidoreductase [Bacteroidales bacterium]HRT33143.1 SDR family NAD(P)-dependent oxidoreductase [Bacteroidales bacterium]HRT83189.1 SDR family NAD(P)-dependent oxidoreductase [Bacteroidales bacterium]